MILLYCYFSLLSYLQAGQTGGCGTFDGFSGCMHKYCQEGGGGCSCKAALIKACSQYIVRDVSRPEVISIFQWDLRCRNRTLCYFYVATRLSPLKK